MDYQTLCLGILFLWDLGLTGTLAYNSYRDRRTRKVLYEQIRDMKERLDEMALSNTQILAILDKVKLATSRLGVRVNTILVELKTLRDTRTQREQELIARIAALETEDVVDKETITTLRTQLEAEQAGDAALEQRLLAELGNISTALDDMAPGEVVVEVPEPNQPIPTPPTPTPVPVPPVDLPAPEPVVEPEPLPEPVVEPEPVVPPVIPSVEVPPVLDPVAPPADSPVVEPVTEPVVPVTPEPETPSDPPVPETPSVPQPEPVTEPDSPEPATEPTAPDSPADKPEEPVTEPEVTPETPAGSAVVETEASADPESAGTATSTKSGRKKKQDG